MRYLVLGGAGFIGSHVAETLVNHEEEVVVLDNFFTGKEENIKPFQKKIKVVRGDICDINALIKEFKGADFVILEAARRAVPHSLKQPNEYNNVNINGTVNVLEAARKQDVKRVVFASSSSVYGDAEKLPLKEGEESDPISPYALTKLAGEKYMKMYYKLYGLETVSLRYFNVFGPRQDPDSQYSAVIPLFIKALANNKKPTIFGDGEQTRDFTYVANVVEGTLKACTAKAAGEVMNLANGDQISVNRLLKELNQIMKKNIKPVYAKPRPGDIKHTRADNSKAKKLLGYENKVSFTEGLKKTVDWFMKSY